MWFDAWEAFGPSSSIAGIVYNFGFYFSVQMESLEVLYSWVSRSSDGYLFIPICGLDKFVCLIMVFDVCESGWCGSDLWKYDSEEEIVLVSVMKWVLWEFGDGFRFIFGFGGYWFRNFSPGYTIKGVS